MTCSAKRVPRSYFRLLWYPILANFFNRYKLGLLFSTFKFSSLLLFQRVVQMSLGNLDFHPWPIDLSSGTRFQNHWLPITALGHKCHCFKPRSLEPYPLGRVPLGRIPSGRIPLGRIPMGRCPLSRVPFSRTSLISPSTRLALRASLVVAVRSF